MVVLNIGCHTIAPSSPRSSDLMAAALSASPALPIYACGFVDSKFEALRAGQVAGPTNQNDAQGGGHAFWFSKYRTNNSGRREFFLENSWGEGWCDGGGCWVSEEFVHQSVWTMYVLDVSRRHS